MTGANILKIQGNRVEKSTKIEGEKKKKKDVPKEFIKKIGKLGMNVEDAEMLYATKIDWTVVYSNNKIYCTEQWCDFHTKIDSDILTNHMISRHKYGEYPCGHPHCNFVGYSKVNYRKDDRSDRFLHLLFID